ncbi:hypothetical protein CSC94_19050 [Zhengella mangrovi]|uniref:Uncharacterized protein n=1 Tax=Zhengella mangrovi TaxID=1982044 RepID=A0A2G1QIV6_9HYPH|nr:hypothetical protein [Zhengella mangrovi]PHP65456.1 hypothetical protein CSC94_19050 [Zhengella mangrovi]
MDKDRQPAAKTAEEARRKRLADQLRANLQRRKAQSRARRSGEPDTRPAGLAADGDSDTGDGG